MIHHTLTRTDPHTDPRTGRPARVAVPRMAPARPYFTPVERGGQVPPFTR